MCPAFLQFWCNEYIVNLLIKTDFTVVCAPCMLEHVCYEPFSLKNFRLVSEIQTSKTRFKQTN